MPLCQEAKATHCLSACLTLRSRDDVLFILEFLLSSTVPGTVVLKGPFPFPFPLPPWFFNTKDPGVWAPNVGTADKGEGDGACRAPCSSLLLLSQRSPRLTHALLHSGHPATPLSTELPLPHLLLPPNHPPKPQALRLRHLLPLGILLFSPVNYGSLCNDGGNTGSNFYCLVFSACWAKRLV